MRSLSPGNAGETLDVKLRFHLRVAHRDAGDARGVENEHVPPVRRAEM